MVRGDVVHVDEVGARDVDVAAAVVEEIRDVQSHAEIEKLR